MYNLDSPITCNDDLLGPSLADICGGSTYIVFMSLLNAFVRSQNKISGICKRVKPVITPDQDYDFVVIGGGAGGSAVAGRLSEVLNWKVLLLEAGPDEPAGADIPSFAARFLGSDVDWQYKTQNESNACKSTNGSCSWPAGKNLGGSTVHNGMMYMRGNPADYNGWAAQGNEGWTWPEVEKFFLLGEDNGEIDRVGRVYHRTGGPLSVERFPNLPPFGHSILAAAVEAGYGVSEDLNGATRTGFSVAQAANKHGVRRSSAAAYLRPVRHRKNLHVSLNSLVTKVVIENGRAVGVDYYKNGELRRAHVAKEVVLSAGSMRSPHILLLSGIGPKEHLESVGLRVVKDLPGVGENLHNHVSYSLRFTIDERDTFDNNWAEAIEYIAFQSGRMSSTGLAQITGKLSSTQTTADNPDIQTYLAGYSANCAPGELGALSSEGKRSITFSPTYLHTKSKGRVSLASSDPLEYPLFWGNYLSDPSDVQGLVEAIELTLALAEMPALKAHNMTLSATPLEACADHTFLSTEYWACAVRQNTSPENHQAGSCKMGPASDPLAVVDSRLRVHGIKGLRIADASIMPQVTSGNTVAPIMMIGERAAYFIKEDLRR